MGQNNLRVILYSAALSVSVGLPSPLQATADVPTPSLTEQVAAAALPAVVNISTLTATPEGTRDFVGSGFIIDPSGIVLTCRHVIAGAYEIKANVLGVGKLTAKPLFISEEIDVALLKVEAGKKLPTVKLGDSDLVHIGDRVMLLGNPLGIGESLSFGVVSALNRNLGQSIYDHFIQTDAALNHGNSGGAMLNMAGEVVGINDALISSPGNTGSIGIGFAMPINDAKFIIDQFLFNGQVIAGTVGVQAQRMTEDLATAFGLDSARGVIVTGVEEHGPADGKILQGDIILKIGAQDASDARAAARLIAVTPPGHTLDVMLLRAGMEQSVTVTVGKSEYNPKKARSWLGHAPDQSKVFATPSDPGMGLSVIDDEMRRKFGLNPDQQGVVVTSVDPKGVAAEQKIIVGDVILSVNGKAVTKPLDVRQYLREVSDNHVPFAALLVAGERNRHWVALPLEADR